MARIKMLTKQEFDPELRQLIDVDNKAPLEVGNVRIYAHCPELAKAFVRFMGVVRKPALLPRRLIELVRLRVAYHNQCRSCMAIRYNDGVRNGVTEEVVCQLETPDEARDLTPAERAALRFADLLGTNHYAITDETIEDLKKYFSEAEIVELGMNIAIFIGFGRLSMAWDMVDELPERFKVRGDKPITPWGGDAIVVGKSRS